MDIVTPGERLKGLRNDQNWTQAEVASKMKTTKNQIGKYERDEQEMTISVLKRFCKLYKVSADYILGLPQGNGPKYHINVEHNEIMNNY